MEADDSDDQELLWCIDCLRCHGPDCPDHGGLVLIKDTPTVSHAVASLPNSLHLENVHGQRQVIARDIIARRTVFGPLEATEVNDEEENNGFVLKIFKKDGKVVRLDTSDEMRCNWMSLVTIATREAHQNVIVYQYKGGLYFTVTKDIPAGEILRLWYAPHYADTLGQPLLNETLKSENVESTTAKSNASYAIISPSTPWENKHGSVRSGRSVASSKRKTVTVESKSSGSTSSTPKNTEAHGILTRSTIRNRSSTLITNNRDDLSSESKLLKASSMQPSASPSFVQKTSYNTRQGAKKSSPESSVGNVTLESSQKAPSAYTVKGNNSLKVPRKNTRKDDRLLMRTSRNSAQPAKDNAKSGTELTRPIGTLLTCTSKTTKKKFDCMKSYHTKPIELLSSVVRPHAEDIITYDEFTLNKTSKKQYKDKKSEGKQSKKQRVKEKNKLVKSLGSSQTKSVKDLTNSSPKQIDPWKNCVSRKVEHLTDEQYRLLQERILDESLRSCHECSLILNNTDQLKKHIQNEHQQEPLQCSHCTKIFVTNDHLSQHMQSIHNDNRNDNVDTTINLGCPLCDRYLSTTRTFRLHLQIFHNENFKCSTCHGSFWDKTKYLVHIREHNIQGVHTPTDTMFSCNKCGKEFTSSKGLSVHQSSVHTEKVFSCSYCDYSTWTELTLHEHILTNHPDNDLRIPDSQKLHCDKCNGVFLRQGTLNRHQLNHKKVEYKCAKCDNVYRRKDSLKNHNCLTSRRRTITVDTVTDHNTANVYECQICLKVFSSRASMRHHAQTHNEKHYTCDICNKEFHKRFNFDSHKYHHLRVTTNRDGIQELIQVDDSSSEKRSCHLCHCQFTRMQPLINHLENHHSLTSPHHICVACQRLFLSQEDLSTHQAQHIRITLPDGLTLDNLHSCPTCCKVFISAKNLRSHIGMHDEKKNHVCEVCGSTFRRADSLKRHLTFCHREHVESSEMKTNTCLICNKSFMGTSSLRLHILSHTNQRDYQCPHCEHSFVQRGNFNRHVMGHDLEKTLACDVCNKVFKFSENLRRHMRVHKVYEFSCQSCSKKFSTQHFLTNHIRKVHQFVEACQCEVCGISFTALNSYRRHMKQKHSNVSRQDYTPIMETR